MPWVAGTVDFRLEIELIEVGDGTGIWDTSVWDTGTWSGDEPNWVDCTAYLMAATTRQGRDRFIVGDFDVGTATFALNNDSGTWTPASGVVSLGQVQIRPGSMVRLSGRWDGTGFDATLSDSATTTGDVDGRTWTNHGTGNTLSFPTPAWTPLWTGRVHNLEDRFDEGATGAVTTLSCVGMLQDLAAYKPDASVPPRTAEGTGARITHIADEASFPTTWRDIDTGLYTCETSALDNNFLEEARVAARVDGGDVFCNKSGYLLFRDGNWLLEDPRSATVQWWIGTTNRALFNVSTDWSLQRIYNDLHYTNGSITATASDSPSQSKYGVRSFQRTIPDNDNTDLQTLADRDIDILSDDQLVIDSVTLTPRNVFEAEVGIDSQIGDLLDVTVTTVPGWSYTQQLHVAGISHRIVPGDWAVSLRLDSRTGATLLT